MLHSYFKHLNLAVVEKKIFKYILFFEPKSSRRSAIFDHMFAI